GLAPIDRLRYRQFGQMFLDQIGELQQNLLAIAGSSLRPRPRFEASARRSYGDVDIRAIALGDFRQYLACGRIDRLEGPCRIEPRHICRRERRAFRNAALKRYRESWSLAT